MPNLTNEELEKILISDEAKTYLDEHPSYNGRAAKIFGKAAIKCQAKATSYAVEKAFEKLNKAQDVIETNPELFAD